MAKRIKPLGGQVLPVLFLDDLAVELVDSKHLQRLALHIVVRTSQTHDGCLIRRIGLDGRARKLCDHRSRTVGTGAARECNRSAIMLHRRISSVCSRTYFAKQISSHGRGEASSRTEIPSECARIATETETIRARQNPDHIHHSRVPIAYARRFSEGPAVDRRRHESFANVMGSHFSLSTLHVAQGLQVTDVSPDISLSMSTQTPLCEGPSHIDGVPRSG